MSHELALIGISNAFRRRRIAAFTVLSIAVSVSLLYTALSATTSLRLSANQFMQDSLTPIDITVNSKVWGNPITADLQQSIRSLPMVNNTIPRIEEHGYVINGSNYTYIAVVGIDLEQEDHIGTILVSNGTLDLSGQGCFITEQARDLLNVSLGDQLDVHLSSGLSFFNITGIGIAVDKGLIGPIIFISLERAWDIFDIKYPDQSVNKVLVEVYDIFDIPVVMQQIQQICGDGFQVTNIKAYSLAVASLFLNQANIILSSLVIVSCSIASFRVFSSFASVFQTRRYETGVVLAFGASRRSILALFLSEVIIIGLIGCVAGIVMGVIVSQVILSFIIVTSQIIFIAPVLQFFQSSLALDITSISISIIAGMILTIFSGYLPAWRASQESVVESLGRGAIPMASGMSLSHHIKRRLQVILGAMGVIFSALVIIQLVSDLFDLGIIREDYLRLGSIPAFLTLAVFLSPRIHASNLIHKTLVMRMNETIRSLSRKNLKRNTLTALIIFNLFTSVTVLFLASTNIGNTITESWKKNINWNSSSVNIVAYFNEPNDPAIVEQLKSMTNVRNAIGINQALEYFIVGSHLEIGLVIGTQIEGFEQMASIALLQSINSTQGFDILMNNASCVISDFTAESMDVGLGDRLYVSGVNLTVVGICASSVPAFIMYAIEPMFIIVSPDTWAMVEAKPFLVSTVLIDSNASENTLLTLSTMPGINPVLVSQIETDYEDALRSIQIIIDSALIALFISTAVSALLSGFAVSSTRRREIGMLASLGMAPSDIAKTLTVESAVSMTTGVIIGAIIGVFVEVSFLPILIRFGNESFTLIDLKTLAFVLSSWLVSILASYFAIRKATNQNIVNLLRDQKRTK